MANAETNALFLRFLWASLDDSRKLLDAIDADTVCELYALSKGQDLSHIVSYVASRDGLVLDAAVKSKFERDEMMAAFRCESMKLAYEQICHTLDTAKIPYLPLKGTVVRPYYPMDSMRTSCDIDVLIHQEDLERAVASFVALGYKEETRAYHDVSLYSPEGIHLELHFSICENMESLDGVLSEAWEHARVAEGYRYEFTPEFFSFHMLAHMAYHFLSGGCGMRPLMDLWVMEHRMGISYLSAEPLLRRAEIFTFACEMAALAERCFTEGDSTVALDHAVRYLLDGGVYGSLSNAVAVSTAETGSSLCYLLHRLFLPYSEMVVGYPVLKKAPILLPFCWMVRIVKTVCQGKTRRVVREISDLQQARHGSVDDAVRLRKRMGL